MIILKVLLQCARSKCVEFPIVTALNWVVSFLTNRMQTVVFTGVKSAPISLLYGLPQGSVLRHLLFNLYTADVIKIAESFGIHIHCNADDVIIYSLFRK